MKPIDPTSWTSEAVRGLLCLSDESRATDRAASVMAGLCGACGVLALVALIVLVRMTK